MKIDVRADISKTLAYLDNYQRDQIPFATSVALNRTANLAKDAMVREMVSVFDRPTRYTLNSLYVKPSTKRSLTVMVGFKDFSPKGKAPWSWIGPHVYGGTRESKRSEDLLRAAGILPQGWYIVPGAGARRNAFGNISSGQMQQILAGLRASRDPAQNTSKGSRNRNKPKQYFAAIPGRTHLKPGVYQRVSQFRIKPVLIFVQSVNYRARLKFEAVVRSTVARHFPREFGKALRDATRTARLPMAARAA